MTGEYRIVYFSPDPFVGGRIAVAALMRTRDGVRAVSSRSLPSAECTGGADVNMLLRTAVRSMEAPLSLGELPTGIGPHFSLAPDIRSIPAKIAKPEEWLAGLLSHRTNDAANPQGPKASTEGRKFLEMQGVDEYVKNRFTPNQSILSKFSGRLPAVTHYVLGKQLLLMEPISARMPQSRIIDINTRFGAYKQAFQQDPSSISCRLISYVLPGAARKDREVDISSLTFADDVFEADNAGSCKRFVEQIRAAA